MNLPISRLIQVSVALAPAAAAGRNFSNLCIVDDSNVISGLQRIIDVSSATEVAQLFGANASVTQAAQIYFGQSPKPATASIGRWLRTATAGMLQGAILSASQSALNLFTAITSGGMNVTVDGVVKNLTGMDFSTALNLNGVATAVTTALSASATCVWNGAQFVISSATTGAGVKASATAHIATNPADADTITVNGIVITFKTAVVTTNQVLIGGTAAQTAVNLNTFLAASANANLLLMSYAVDPVGATVTLTSKTVGVAGNSLTLVTSVSGKITLSGATLLGGLNPSSVSYATAPGSGQDVSALMGLTSALALPLVPGYDAESALQAVVALDLISNGWYGIGFGSSVMPSDDQFVAIAGFIEADPIIRMLGITVQNTGALSSLVTSDLGSRLMALGYLQTFYQYSSFNAYAALSMFGRLFTVDFSGENTMIDLMYKQEPGVVAESLDTQEADTLQAKRYNVYAAYNNDTSIIQYSTMAGPAYIDEIYGLDAMQNAIQTAEFNVNYQSTTKVPQTDAGTNQFVNAASNVCGQYVTNGFGAPGVWNGPSFGQLLTGQFLKNGFYVYAPSVASLSPSDTAARKSPPIQIAFKLAGATQIVDVALTASR